jgi:2-polyprenyl-3-methyl-5-hydroxy-6-metoxy-1,4-benzoquinol methylase
MKRACEPELLDSLPFDHPDAIHSRRDLRLVNGFMRTKSWFRRVLSVLVRPGEPVLELGAGTGEVGRSLIREGIAVDGLDLCPRPSHWPEGRLWHTADLKHFSGYGAYPVVIGNLILHQFTDAELAALGTELRRTCRVVVASEPQRSRLSQKMMAMVGPLLGANHVTLHDARISIAAGFLGDELAVTMGFDSGDWECTCTKQAPGALRMVAVRRL